MAKYMHRRQYLKLYRRLCAKRYFICIVAWFTFCFLSLCIILVLARNKPTAAITRQEDVSSSKYFQKERDNTLSFTKDNLSDENVPYRGVTKGTEAGKFESTDEAPTDLSLRYSETELFLFIAITTDHKNFEARQAVRNTWLQFPKIPNWEAYFFVMQSPNSSLQRQLEEEAKEYKDIVILPYLETYSNLTLKTLSLMEWIDKNINATFIFKSDDDAYVNVPRLVLWLLKKPTQKFYTGGVNRNSKPVRIKGHKWYVSYDEYPYKYYPDYCIGNGYVISRDLVSVLGNCLPEDLSCTNDYPSCVPRKSCSVPLQFYRLIGLEDITVAIILKGSQGVECVHGDGKFINEPYFYCNTKYSPRCLMGLKQIEDQNIVCNPRYEVFFIHRVVPEQMYRYHLNGPGIGANIKMSQRICLFKKYGSSGV